VCECAYVHFPGEHSQSVLSPKRLKQKLDLRTREELEVFVDWLNNSALFVEGRLVPGPTQCADTQW
jgi:hypothetical protein